MSYLKDNFLIGAILGLIFPIFSFLIFSSLISKGLFFLEESTLFVLTCIVNLPIFRILMVNFNYEKIGRGLLFSTFLLLFYYIYKYM